MNKKTIGRTEAQKKRISDLTKIKYRLPKNVEKRRVKKEENLKKKRWAEAERTKMVARATRGTYYNKST